MLKLLLGTAALSAFRIEKLLVKLKLCCPQLNSLTANALYWVKSTTPLDAEENHRLAQLLCPVEQPLPTSSAQTWVVVVAPRVGTVSSWSSKATDIAHNCGLQHIVRIERGVVYQLQLNQSVTLNPSLVTQLLAVLHDPLTQTAFTDLTQIMGLFNEQAAQPLAYIDLLAQGLPALEQANQRLGLALSQEEMTYLHQHYQQWQRNPTDVELMMFAQANSEHCRHKIFNANWVIDGVLAPHSLFSMVKHTYAQHPTGVLSAYKDNAAVVEGSFGQRFFADPTTQEYRKHDEWIHFLIKVETHNHPTAISPYPGAATGSGGEIRDEGATGRGAKPKAGLTGFAVSNLHVPDFQQPWEIFYGQPAHLSSALTIMLEAPIGAAAFNNEFGRPNICGYFRSFEQQFNGEVRGYHKPIMLAGGLGNIRASHVQKQSIPPGALIIVLGGPAMQIGLGGGAASSLAAGESSAELDFASVQRDNAEMQRRCQEVIDHCWALGDANPIVSIHDVGAGGLSNALPELVHDSDRGGQFALRAIPNAEQSMSPLAIWCNEAQERYVLAILPDELPHFAAIADRERCPYAVVGHATEAAHLKVDDALFDTTPIDMPLSVLLGKPPKMQREVVRVVPKTTPLNTATIDLQAAVERILRLPAVASKSFLITIGDRSVTGLIARDQMVGPWQVPVSDVAVTLADYSAYCGEAMAMGERSPIALLNPAASGRMAIAEAITNLAAADVNHLSLVKLSANWMAACGHPGEDAALFDTVKAVAYELCPELQLTIPVGKDSLSMRASWQQDNQAYSVTAPLSLVISAFAPVEDVCKTLTPALQRSDEPSFLLFIDLGHGKQRLGGSALGQVFNIIDDATPDLESPKDLAAFFQAMSALKKAELLLAYHDRSDGGLFVTLCEMAFAGHLGITIDLTALGHDVVASLWNEELGAVLQVPERYRAQVLSILALHHLTHLSHEIGQINTQDELIFSHHQQVILRGQRCDWQRWWSETSYRLQALRDNPACAEQEFAAILRTDDPGLSASLTFDPREDITIPFIHPLTKPRVAILREQGVNGHIEMACAFDRAGFTSVDVHMSDLLAGRVNLGDFIGLAACGGFSYGDVLGAGRGWAETILLHPQARAMFTDFFARPDTFTLGVCNGCQMLAHLQSLIPGTELWPRFVRNVSEQYEARLVMVEVTPSPSLFFQDMQGSRMPIVVAHGEGQPVWRSATLAEQAQHNAIVALRYVDNWGRVTENYPQNPNGSLAGMTAFTSTDGRATIMMPHPERVFRTAQLSWHPQQWGEDSPWLRLFRNARRWVG